MSRRTKPFEQYRTLLSDGRSVVCVVVLEPVPFTAWLIANSKGDALARVREYGPPSPHIRSELRPGQRLADAAASDPQGLVFVRETSEWFPTKVSPSIELPQYLAEGDPTPESH